jgi:CheY-like chemotaxis protein
MMSASDIQTEGILVVDDEEVIVFAITQLLKVQGFENLQAAYDGSDCVELVLQNREAISLVILDIRMDHMDGFTTVRALMEKYDGVLGVIFMTGYASLRLEEEARALGNDNILVLDFMHKPFEMTDLLDVVSRNLPTVLEKRKELAGDS